LCQEESSQARQRWAKQPCLSPAGCCCVIVCRMLVFCVPTEKPTEVTLLQQVHIVPRAACLLEPQQPAQQPGKWQPAGCGARICCAAKWLTAIALLAGPATESPRATWRCCCLPQKVATVEPLSMGMYRPQQLFPRPHGQLLGSQPHPVLALVMLITKARSGEHSTAQNSFQHSLTQPKWVCVTAPQLCTTTFAVESLLTSAAELCCNAIRTRCASAALRSSDMLH
jgi:hypothetical protein